MIYFSSPYLKGNVGKAYNDFIYYMPDDSWICLTDADTMFLNPKYAEQLQEYINKFPDIDLFTAYCNRVGERRQVLNGIVSKNANIINHFKIAERLATKPPSIKPITVPISGFLMMFKRGLWERTGGFTDGVLGVDNLFSTIVLKLGCKIGLMETVYLFHYYRLHKNIGDKTHLL